jgi:two-component system, NarL family, nitrate/nitrite response regulator NarL
VERRQISVVVAVAGVDFLRELRSQVARQGDIVLLREPQDALQTLRAVGNLRPDVLLLDSAIANIDGSGDDTSVVPAIHSRSPGTKIILIADKFSEGAVVKAFQQGARGCMIRTAMPEDCVRAIRVVSQGEVWIGRRELASILDDLLTRLGRFNDASVAGSGQLSLRESEVASELKLGLTNKEIARKLHISDTTVKTHIEHIFQKLNVSSRVRAAILAAPSLKQADTDTSPTPKVARR